MFNFTGLYTDLYQLTMSQVYFLQGKHNQLAVFDYFFRKLPFSGGYAVFAGLDDLLDILENFHFDKPAIDFLHAQGFNPQFLQYLKNFRFKGTLYSVHEGELVFPICPILTVEANIIEAQIIETILLNVLNFQTLIATKASRIRQVAGNCRLLEFGLRRAQGPGGYYASRAAVIGGFQATSNVCAGKDYAIGLAGTMAHSFVQSYENELLAFRDFAQSWPNKCVLLVDTYNTLKSGVPNAILVAHEMEAQGLRLQGIRIDSGDLAHLAKQARQMLNEAKLEYVKITVSNQLDEYVIKSLLEQGAPIDVFGVGTNLAIGAPDATLDGVYKLALIDEKPSMKLSETSVKITLPYKKQVYRVLDSEGNFAGQDKIALASEKSPDFSSLRLDTAKSGSLSNFTGEPLLHKVMENGVRVYPAKTLNEIAQYCQQRLEKLPAEYKRFINPSRYKTELSKQLKLQRDQLIEEKLNGTT